MGESLLEAMKRMGQECDKWPESMKRMHEIRLKADEYFRKEERMNYEIYDGVVWMKVTLDGEWSEISFTLEQAKGFQEELTAAIAELEAGGGE